VATAWSLDGKQTQTISTRLWVGFRAGMMLPHQTMGTKRRQSPLAGLRRARSLRAQGNGPAGACASGEPSNEKRGQVRSLTPLPTWLNGVQPQSTLLDQHEVRLGTFGVRNSAHHPQKDKSLRNRNHARGDPEHQAEHRQPVAQPIERPGHCDRSKKFVQMCWT
jgi:hypothetical protein